MRNLQPITPQLFKARLEEVLSCGGLEIEFRGSDACIPYMLSDAVESILILHNCRITGEYIPGAARAEFVEDEQKAIIFRREDGNIFTLWYDGIAQDTRLYRYDEIAHFWVNRLEQWRRLTYMIGTMHDKWQHLGRDYCNDKELEILRLIEFGPFRAFTPVDFSLDYRYDESAEGSVLMEKLALEVGDKFFARLCRIYARHPFELLRRYMARYLGHDKAIPIHELIWHKTMEAARLWPERYYGEEENARRNQLRQEAHEQLSALGFKGSYPLYTLGRAQVLAVEEHPFTQFEEGDFVFSIRFMVSMSRKEGICAGFFFGKENYSFIAKSVDDILS